LQASCLPAAVFGWSVENYGGEAVRVTIAFTWQNGYGEGVARKALDTQNAVLE
jgi:hypothetical protein